LLEGEGTGSAVNKSVALAKKFKDTIKKIDGTEANLSVNWEKQ
jgi:hypothetical protein